MKETIDLRNYSSYSILEALMRINEFEGNIVEINIRHIPQIDTSSIVCITDKNNIIQYILNRNLAKGEIDFIKSKEILYIENKYKDLKKVGLMQTIYRKLYEEEL